MKQDIKKAYASIIKEMRYIRDNDKNYNPDIVWLKMWDKTKELSKN